MCCFSLCYTFDYFVWGCVGAVPPQDMCGSQKTNVGRLSLLRRWGSWETNSGHGLGSTHICWAPSLAWCAVPLLSAFSACSLHVCLLFSPRCSSLSQWPKHFHLWGFSAVCIICAWCSPSSLHLRGDGFLRFVVLFICRSVCPHIRVCATYVPGGHGEQKELDSLKLELWVAVNHHVVARTWT